MSTMTTIRAVHEYTPIESATQIRILALQPAPNFEHPIKATIITRPLEPDFRSYRLTQPIPYQAVSYCWGPSDSGLALECDGKRIRISSNVDCMLRHLRKTSGPRNLWVDSICINQANVPEKTAQVQCMGKIYRRAQKVHIWLGDACPEDHIPWVFNSLQSLTVLETLPSPDAFDGLEDGKELLGRFISRPWFGRRWILQELALAQDATVHCGHHKISWNWLKEGLNLLTQESAVARFGFNYKAAERIRGVVSMKKPSRDFLERIFGLHLSDCLDSRDRFYSLYSIEGDFSVGTPKQNAKWHHPCMPNVDYSKDWMHLYIDFAKQHIATGHFPTILQHVLSFGSLYDQSPDLPSWVPNWHLERKAALRNTQNQDVHKWHNVGTKQPDGPILRGWIIDITNKHEQDDASTSSPTTFMQPIENVLETVLIPTPAERDDMVFGADKRQEKIEEICAAAADAIMDSQCFYASGKFDWECVQSYIDDERVLNSEITERKRLSLGLEDDIEQCLKAGDGYQSRLRDEVNRVLKGFKIYIMYSKYLGAVPIICRPEIQSGDCIFQPATGRHDLKIKTVDAFLLRPVEASREVNGFEGRTFRFVGKCFPPFGAAAGYGERRSYDGLAEPDHAQFILV